MKSTIMYFILTIILISCNSTYYLKYDDDSFSEVNRKLLGEDATVKLSNGRHIDVSRIRLDRENSIVGMENVQTDSIMEIYVNNNARGALKGMGIGILSGFSLASMVYLNDKDNPFSEWTFISLPIAGFLSGGIIGAIHGDIDNYIFPAPERQTSNETVSVKISSVLEQSYKDITVLWQAKKIYLVREEYNYTALSADGKNLYIIVPKKVFQEKFK